MNSVSPGVVVLNALLQLTDPWTYAFRASRNRCHLSISLVVAVEILDAGIVIWTACKFGPR